MCIKATRTRARLGRVCSLCRQSQASPPLAQPSSGLPHMGHGDRQRSTCHSNAPVEDRNNGDRAVCLAGCSVLPNLPSQSTFLTYPPTYLPTKLVSDALRSLRHATVLFTPPWLACCSPALGVPTEPHPLTHTSIRHKPPTLARWRASAFHVRAKTHASSSG